MLYSCCNNKLLLCKIRQLQRAGNNQVRRHGHDSACGRIRYVNMQRHMPTTPLSQSQNTSKNCAFLCPFCFKVKSVRLHFITNPVKKSIFQYLILGCKRSLNHCNIVIQHCRKVSANYCRSACSVNYGASSLFTVSSAFMYKNNVSMTTLYVTSDRPQVH